MDQKLVLICVFFFSVTNAEMLNVTIFYDAISPESGKFITEQVYPALSGDLKGHVLINWVPFGKTKFTIRDKDIHIICERGLNECYENKVHGCAIDRINSSYYYDARESRGLILLKFINCMMKESSKFADNVSPGAKCAHYHNINIWNHIEQCANNTEGENILKYNGAITKNFQNPLMYEPTVVINNEYNMKLNEMAQHDFVGVVCKQFKTTFLHVCESHNSAISIGTSPLLGLLVYALAKLFN